MMDENQCFRLALLYLVHMPIMNFMEPNTPNLSYVKQKNEAKIIHEAAYPDLMYPFTTPTGLTVRWRE